MDWDRKVKRHLKDKLLEYAESEFHLLLNETTIAYKGISKELVKLFNILHLKTDFNEYLAYDLF